jgi:sucrose-6-phosphate hydrolase SacC (GH32 family)
MEILIDRASIEIYANDGQAVISNCFTPSEKADDFVLFTNGGELEVIKMEAYKIESVWSR